LEPKKKGIKFFWERLGLTQVWVLFGKAILISNPPDLTEANFGYRSRTGSMGSRNKPFYTQVKRALHRPTYIPQV